MKSSKKGLSFLELMDKSGQEFLGLCRGREHVPIQPEVSSSSNLLNDFWGSVLLGGVVQLETKELS